MDQKTTSGLAPQQPRETENASTLEVATAPAAVRAVPVLASVPWFQEKKSAAPVAAPEPRVPEPQAIDPAMFRPHQIVASPDLGVTSDGDFTQWRVDPPKVSPEPPPAEVTASPSEASRALATDEVLRASVAEPVLRASVAEPVLRASVTEPVLRASVTEPAPTLQPVTTPAITPSRKIGVASDYEKTLQDETRWRFDAPESAGHTSRDAEPVGVAIEPTLWHQRVAAVDGVIRRHHRAIVLLALLTAAGLMMLVLQGQRTQSNPAPENLTPAASDSQRPAIGSAAPLTSKPAPLATTAKQTSESLGDATQPSTARGPGRDRGLEGLALSPESDDNAPITPIEPHREPHSVDDPAVAATQQPYESTGAPEIMPSNPSMSPAQLTQLQGPRAQLTGEILSIPQQAKHDQHESSLH